MTRGHAAGLVILTMLAILYALYSARAIVFPIVLAFLIAFPLRPAVRWLARRYVPAFIGAGLVVGLLLLVLFRGGQLLMEPATMWIAEAPENLRVAETKLREFRRSFESINAASQTVEEIAQGGEPEAVQVEIKQPSLTSLVLSTTGSLLAGAMIAVTLVYLLLAFGDGLLAAIIKLMPTYHDKTNVRQMCDRAEGTISRYLLTSTLINIALGVVIGGGLWLIGMPNPVLWGVMAALLNYVPFLGLAVGSAVVFVVALVSFDSALYALLAPAIYLTANGIEGNLITPALLGRSMQLNIIIVFLFIVIWGWMWGIGGSLIAVPLLAIVKIVCEHFERLRPVAAILSAP
jgi:predicted PurR-regulated permease PerM